MFDTRLKKQSPITREMLGGLNFFTLQQTDTVHMVDLDLSQLDDALTDDWFPEEAAHCHIYFSNTRNYIKFRYDDRLQEFRITLKAMAIKIGQCDAEPVVAFLNKNNIQWGNKDAHHFHPKLRRGHDVAIDHDM